MAKKTRKQKAKQQMRYSRAKEQAERRQSGGDFTSIVLPEGANLFKLKKSGTYRLEIIPYEVKVDHNPFAKKGEYHYERTYYVHRGIGADPKDAYVCLSKTFKKPCPACDYVAKLAKDPEHDPDIVKQMMPKERQLFNVYDHAEPDKGVQIWEISYHQFGKQLNVKLRNSDEDDGYENFYHLGDDGLTLKLGVEENPPYGFQVEDIEFKPRKTALDDDVAEGAYDLDTLLKPLPPKELKAVITQSKVDSDDDDEDEDEKPAKKGKKKKSDILTADEVGIEVGSRVEHDEHGECVVVHVSGDGTSLTLEDEDEEQHKAIGCDEVELLDDEDDDFDDDEDEKPAKKKGKAAAKPKAKAKSKKAAVEEDEEDDEDDEDDDEDDEDEDEPPPKKGKAKGKAKPKAKPAPKKGKGKKAADEEDEDDDDDWDDDDDDWGDDDED